MTEITQILCFFSQHPSAAPVYPLSKKLWFLFHLHTEMALSWGGERPCYLFHYFSHRRPITLYGAQTQQCWRALPSYVNLIISLGASRSFTRAKLSSISDLGYYNGGFSFTLGFKSIFCNARFLPCTSISLSSVCLNWVSWTCYTPNKAVYSLVPSLSLLVFCTEQ